MYGRWRAFRGRVVDRTVMDVVLIDDHEAMRDGLEALLARKGIDTIGTAGSAADAVKLLADLTPDVAVVDVHLPDESGLRLVRRLRDEHPRLPVLIYTGVEDIATLADALDSGAAGFALKLGGITKLIQGLRLVAAGKRYVDPAVRVVLDANVDAQPLLLTSREREVFDLLAQGLTGEEIATRLTVSAETVRTHIRNGMAKLDARTRTGAVVQALEMHEIER
jgi:DNA-binding NarL/FixJ family response regulator